MKSDFKTPLPRSLTSNVPLAPFTTFHIGGPARYFVEAQSLDEVQDALRFAGERSIPVFILGSGSNILIADGGFEGLVLAVRIAGVTSQQQGNQTLITAGAGIVWDELVQRTIERSLAGFECLSGVPGTVGGAVAVNLGCYGAQCSDSFVSAEVIDLRDPAKAVRMLAKNDCHFSYHDSLFSREPGRYLILRATFTLPTSNSPQPTYQDSRFDLAALLAKNGRPPTLLDVRNAVLDVREQKGNLVMKGRLSYKGAGSFFHMPFVSQEQYARVTTQARKLDAEKEERLRPWAWEQPNKTYKIAPGFLLEYTEFQKGYVRGPVGISPKHTLAIINLGDASAADVAGLAADMRSAVENLFGVSLEREVEYVGFS